MLFVGIDIAKNKHDICILDSLGTLLVKQLTISNTKEGFMTLHNQLSKLLAETGDKMKVGMEDTGHYSNNLLYFLRSNNYSTYSYNPYLIKEFAKSQSLRRTKTDKADARTIALKLMTDLQPEKFKIDEKAEELKVLTRHRNRFGQKQAELKMQFTRILDISFPELASSVGSTHSNYVYELLKSYRSPSKLSYGHLTSITTLLAKNSRGRIGRLKAIELRELAKNSIGTNSFALELELKQVIQLIENYQSQLKIIDEEIKKLMDQMDSPILSIPGISYRLGSVILSEIRTISNFKTAAQLLAFEGMEPSVYQSGQFEGTGIMVKRGSPHLRWAMHNAARLVAQYSPTFRSYFEKKLAEGKHYNVALSHVAKKLTRIIFYLLKTDQTFDESRLV